MAVFDNLHSRVVFWLKILLPLAALAILSTLFLFSRRMDTEGALPYAQVEIDDLLREQRLTAPEFAGMTTDGAALQISAATAFPGTSGNSAKAEDVVAAYDTPGGLRVDLRAARALLDYASGRMTLSGGVDIVTSTGYQISAQGLDAATDRTELLSDGPIDAKAPYGNIEAGNMSMRLGGADTASYLLIFDQGVKLVYQPEK